MLNPKLPELILLIIRNLLKKVQFIVIVGLSLLINGPLHSQDGKFGLVIEGGPSVSYMYKSTFSKDYYSPVIGGFAGVMFDYRFKEHWMLETGLAWERKGTLFYGYFDQGRPYQIRLDEFFYFNYLTIPVLLKAKTGGKVRFVISAGPYFSILLKQTYINNTAAKRNDNGFTIDPSTYTASSPYDFGFTASLGVEAALTKNMNISLDLRDNAGLINTFLFPMFTGSDGTPYYTDRKSYFNSAIVCIGFSYFFGKEKEE